jgi:uncharacterized DUF497 family protein
MASEPSFEWDDAKAASNARKHGVSFAEATTVFFDVDRIDFDVSRPQDGEGRRKVVGMIEERLFSVLYTVRDGSIRVISARRANTQEARRYGDSEVHS